MNFARTETKRYSSIAKNIVKTQVSLCIERATFLDIFIDIRRGEKITLVDGAENKLVKRIHYTGYQYLIQFEDGSTLHKAAGETVLKVEVTL